MLLSNLLAVLALVLLFAGLWGIRHTWIFVAWPIGFVFLFLAEMALPD
jgi:hypothetical protein